MRVPDSSRSRLVEALDVSSSLVVAERRRLIATLGAYPIELSMPHGDVVAAVALIDLCVLPHMRGRGHLRSLVTRFLEDARARNEVLCVLNTDEHELYPRFGFGVASFARTATLFNNGGESLRIDESITVEQLSIVEARAVLPELFEEIARLRNGEVTRTEVWWGEYFDEARRHGDATSFRVGVRNGAIDAYAVANKTADGDCVIAEFAALDPEVARAVICSQLASEPCGALRFRAVPEDLDLASLLGGSVVVEMGAATPKSWLRIADVEAGLALRRYAGAGELCFSVEDATAPWNSACYRLTTAHDGVASIEKTDATPQLCLDVAALATIFAGARSPSAVADDKGLCASDADALEIADALFAGPVAPFCSTLL